MERKRFRDHVMMKLWELITRINCKLFVLVYYELISSYSLYIHKYGYSKMDGPGPSERTMSRVDP